MSDEIGVIPKHIEEELASLRSELDVIPSKAIDNNVIFSAGIDEWGLSDTINLSIDSNGVVTDITVLSIGEYGINSSARFTMLHAPFRSPWS